MSVVAFPSQVLTPEEMTMIAARVEHAGHYRCVSADAAGGPPALALLNGERQVRGRIVKRHGVFHVLDARGFPVLRSRRLEDVLATLTK